MKPQNNRAGLWLAIALLASGCGQADDPQVRKYRDALVLSADPGGSVTIEEARSNIESETRIVLTGRIGVADLENWCAEDEAMVYISEGSPDSHYNTSDGHDPSTCPFCKRKWKVEDSIAIVNLVDGSGQRIPLHAGKLFDFQKGDIVVVQGTASLNDEGYLVVDATGLFLQQES